MAMMSGVTTGLGAETFLSRRGYTAQAERSWTQVVELISDVYDEQTNPDGYISLGIAENRLMHKELLQQIHKNFQLPERMLTYGDGGYGSRELRNAFADFLTEHLKAKEAIPRDHVICFPGVTPAIEGIATMIADPGEGLLLGRPFYGSFPHDTELRAGVKCVQVAFGNTDPFGAEAVAVYEKALLSAEGNGTKIRGLILCSPHNPLGKCYPKDTLVEILRLCQKHQMHLISDEIYALSVWENKDAPQATPFTSVLELISTEIINSDLVHVLWGVSKDFGANGLRLGCMISNNEPLRVALIAHSIFTFPSGVSDKIVVDLLADSRFMLGYIQENQRRLGHAYAHVVAFLKEKELPYYAGSNAAFFIWIELRTTYLKNHGRSIDISHTEGTEVDLELYEKLLDERVFISKGIAYGAEHGGWFRLVFAHPDDYLDKGLERIWRVVGGVAGL